MSELIRRYAERIDALGVRQRVLIFLFLALTLVLIANAAFIDPLRAKHKRLSAEVAQQEKEIATLQADLQRLVMGNQVDPDAANRARQAVLREELRQLNLRIVEEQRKRRRKASHTTSHARSKLKVCTVSFKVSVGCAATPSSARAQ